VYIERNNNHLDDDNHLVLYTHTVLFLGCVLAFIIFDECGQFCELLTRDF